MDKFTNAQKKSRNINTGISVLNIKLLIYILCFARISPINSLAM